MSLGTPYPEFEKEWQHSLRTLPALLTSIMGNIYGIIFFLAALFTVAGYARYRIRKRRLIDEEEEISPEGP
jgi:hypothetical protein